MSYKKGLVLAFAVIIVANLVVLGRVAFNRIEVVSELTFSERELVQSYKHDFDSGASLELRWRVNNARDYWSNNLNVNPRVIKDLGFEEDCSRYRDSERKAFVLMELEGTAWQNAKALDIARLSEQLEKAENDNERRSIERQINDWDEQHTRLYATAVAAEPESLKALIRDAQKQFILTGFVRADCSENDVYIDRLAIERLNVNVASLPNGKLPMKYQVNVAVGVLGEAWITRIEAR